MTLSTVQSNNKLVKYTEEINFEYVRENLFSPYMGEDITSIIRVRNQMKSGGEQMNIPLVARLKGTGVSTGPLTGQEEEIDDYGCRLWVDFARNAVKTNKYQQQIDSADVFGSAKPLLSDWGKELQRDEIIEAMMALPSEAAPPGLAVGAGNRVNGIKFEASTAADRNTWVAGNADRILFGASRGNYNATFATALDTIDLTLDKCDRKALSLMKYMAKQAQPRIRPMKVEDGREYLVVFADGATFRDIKESLYEVNKDSRAREGGGFGKNPLARDGDLEWDGLIIREIPDIDPYVFGGVAGQPNWTTQLTNTGTILCHPVFMCGQSALSLGWGQMARPTFLKDDDYQFNTGAGVEMCYGVGKLFKKHPKASGPLKQWGMVTGFFAASAM